MIYVLWFNINEILCLMNKKPKNDKPGILDPFAYLVMGIKEQLWKTYKPNKKCKKIYQQKALKYFKKKIKKYEKQQKYIGGVKNELKYENKGLIKIPCLSGLCVIELVCCHNVCYLFGILWPFFRMMLQLKIIETKVNPNMTSPAPAVALLLLLCNPKNYHDCASIMRLHSLWSYRLVRL